MKQTIFTIILLLVLIGGVGYYGYTLILSPNPISESVLESTLGEIDSATEDIEVQGINTETITDLEDIALHTVAVTPATTSDIDTLLAELNSFSISDTSGYSTSLADL